MQQYFTRYSQQLIGQYSAHLLKIDSFVGVNKYLVYICMRKLIFQENN